MSLNTPPQPSHCPRILIVDDDQDIRVLLSDFLSQNGLDPQQAGDGEEMFHRLAQAAFDLIVLDLNLPGRNGIELCRQLRQDSNIPVIMLTAKTHHIDRIVGLESGADDYVCKPFEPLELLSRIRSVLRRTAAAAMQEPQPRDPARLRFQGWALDLLARHLISPAGVIVSLSGAEFRLLKLFLDHPNRVLSRDRLMDWMHGREAGPYDRSIDLQVSRIRLKVQDDAKSPGIIKTVRSEGYVLTVPVEVEYR
jgi:two-component system OmpR family response regulator